MPLARQRIIEVENSQSAPQVRHDAGLRVRGGHNQRDVACNTRPCFAGKAAGLLEREQMHFKTRQ
eukprot:7339614-Lingulodinium_polyedra.AAC.1